jgi:hypothetical protein
MYGLEYQHLSESRPGVPDPRLHPKWTPTREGMTDLKAF